MSSCQACQAPSELFLCGKHIRELRTLLNDLPQWLDHLLDESVRHVKKSDGGPTSARREPFTGDDEVLPKCVCGHPEHDGESCDGVDVTTVEHHAVTLDEQPDVTIENVEKPCGCTQYRPARSQTRMRDQFLASGGVNARASRHLDAVRNAITTWQRVLCDQRRRDWVTVVPADFVGPLRPGEFRRYSYPIVDDAAYWLAWNVTAIASGEYAGECYTDFTTGQKVTERLVDLPITTRWLGPCPTWQDHLRRRCRTELTCREDDLEVTCPVCRRTHVANRVQLLAMNELRNEKMTVEEILRYNRYQPQEWQINERTLRRWRRPGPHGEEPKLKPRGYRRPNGRDVINRHSELDQPLYLYSDIERLRADGPQRRVAQ